MSSIQDKGSESEFSGYVVTALVTIAIFIIAYLATCYDCSVEESKKIKENYVVYSERDKWHCRECDGLNRMSCGNCANCGYCYDFKGKGECVPGDASGPYFRDDCVDYEYVSPVNYADVYPGWSYFYDGYYDGSYGSVNGGHTRRNFHDHDHDHDHNHDHDHDIDIDHRREGGTDRGTYRGTDIGTDRGTDRGIGRRISEGGKNLGGVPVKSGNDSIGTLKMGSNRGLSVRTNSSRGSINKDSMIKGSLNSSRSRSGGGRK